MAQYEHERPCDTTRYSSREIHRAGQALSEDVARGDLQYLQTMFEYYPLEAVPNVWEGDEGMMEHVPDFPVPPCIALPEQLVSEADDSIPRVCHNIRPGPEIHDDGYSVPIVRHNKRPRREIHDDGYSVPIVRHNKSLRPEIHDDGDSIPIVRHNKKPRPEIRGDGNLGVNLIVTKKRAMKTKFWVNLVKVYESLGSIQNTLHWMVIAKFASEKEKDRKTACFTLNRLHGYLKKINSVLDNADEIYNESKICDMFQKMSPSKKLKFINRNALQGEVPGSLACIVAKFMEVRKQMREFVLTNWTQMEPFHKLLQGLMKCIRKKKLVFSWKKILFRGAKVLFVGRDRVYKQLVSGAGARSEMPGCDVKQGGGRHSKNRKSQHVGDTEASNELNKEEEFWKKVVQLKTLAEKVEVALSMVNDVGVPSNSKLSVKNGSDICRQMFLARRNIVIINKTLVKLKGEMQTNNYEDKQPFSTDDLVYQGIDLTSENSLDVIEAMLNKLQDHYLRIQDENFSVLEKIGYIWKVGFQKCVNKNIVLVRICAHSKSDLRTPGFNRVSKRPPKILHTNNDPIQDSQKNPDGDYDSQKNPDGDYDSQKPVVEETGDDGSDEDYPDFSKTVNSMSFFMSNLEPGALKVNEPSFTPATEEFIEQEKQYWDRLQTLLLKINKVFHQIEEKGSQSFSEKFIMKKSMKMLHNRIKGLLLIYQSERDRGCQAGYCMRVTYQVQGQMPANTEDILVKSLDQIEDRIHAAYKSYIKIAKKLGVPFSYKLC